MLVPGSDILYLWVHVTIESITEPVPIHCNHKDLLDSTTIPCDLLDLTLPCCLY